MPFGFKRAVAVFQRLHMRLFIDVGENVVYLDDLSIATETYEEHLQVLIYVLRVLRQNELELNLRKCKFATKN